MSQADYSITLPQGNYDGARFAGRCDQYSISIEAGSSARDMDISHLKFTQISAPGVDLSGLQAEQSSIITLYTPTATLDGANFTDATLGITSNLSGAHMHEASMRNVNAPGVNFSMADMSGTDMSGAILRDANFSNATLRGADMTGADVTGANFTHADIRGLTIDGQPVSFQQLADLGGRVDPVALIREQAQARGMLYEPEQPATSAGPLPGMPQLAWTDRPITESFGRDFDPGGVPGGDGQGRGNGGLGTA